MSWSSWLQSGYVAKIGNELCSSSVRFAEAYFDSVAAITGSAEPVYGEEAIHSITKTVTPETAYTELEPDDYKWIAPEWGSNVETQTFYITADSGHMCFAQIIHSNPTGLQYTAQFTCRIFDPKNPENNIWTSTSLEDYSTEHDEHRTFSAKGVKVSLSDDNKTYKLKITVNPETIVDLTMTRVTPAFKIGKDGYTIFGTDTAKPWGTMRHLFWPRCTVDGVILIKGVPLDVTGRGEFIHALQGMKPHHAARQWNFANFQGSKISATMMEFTTPESYGSTKVNVGGIAMDEQILAATVQNVASHLESKTDPDTEWPEPTKMRFEWNGVTATPRDSTQPKVHAVIEQTLASRLERVDVLAEIPPWLKKIAHGVSGTKPFIYQYAEKAKISVTVGEEVIEDEGTLFIEATFIS